MANSLKYANAAKLDIKIRTEKGKYSIMIADNGKGFDTTKLDPSKQNGMENMRYRAKDIACDLSIRTQVSIGTTIRISKL